MRNLQSEVELKMDTAELTRQIAALRLCASQIGFALDTLLVELHRVSDEDAPAGKD